MPAPGLTASNGNMPAEGACARNAAEQPEHVAGDGMQPRTVRELALDIRKERLQRLPRRGEGCVLAEEFRDRQPSSRHGS